MTTPRTPLARFAALLAFPLLTATVSAQENEASNEPQATSPVEKVQVGHWLEVRGELGEDGVFKGEEVEVKSPESDEILIGTVSSFDPRSKSFEVLGQRVMTTESTEYDGVDRDQLEGVRVKVEGDYLGPDEFRASEVNQRGEGRDRIAGRVDQVSRTGDAVTARIMDYSVRLPDSVEHARPIESIAVAPGGALGGGIDEDDLFGDGIPLGDRVMLAGQVELETTSEENFDLDREDAEDRRDDEAAARLRVQWQASPKIYAVGEVRGNRLHRDDQEDGSLSLDQARLGETFLYFRSPFNESLDFQLGRQDFDDQREWLYDENLDGLRLIQRFRPLRVELSVTTKLSDGSPRDEDSTNYIAYLAHERGERHFALYGLHRQVSGDSGDRPTHVGFRFLTEQSWLDVAYLTGQLAGRDVGGWGADVGRTWESDAIEPFSFTLAYAYGSGDDGEDDDGTDRTFRQTGYHDNNAKFAGVTSFRYYGELADPELANLHIATAGIGARLARRTSLDLVAHYYRQDQPRTRLFDSALDGRPDGVHDELGWEFDLVFGERRWKGWDLEAVAAYFVPSDAFVDEDEALLGRVQLRYRF